MIKRKQTIAKKIPLNIIINLNLLYAERTIWSQRFKGWTRYRVKKPRLPNTEDSSLKWIEKSENCPTSFSSFIGNHNEKIIQSVAHTLSVFGLSKSLPEVLTIYGPSGSGKSAILKVISKNLIDELNLSNNQASKW